MSKKPYQKKNQIKTVKIFGITAKSIHFPPNTTLEEGLKTLEDSSATATSPTQMPL
jgi:hypothetical protein